MSGNIEHMFGTGTQVHDYWEPPDTSRSRELVEELVAASRAENQAAARRLAAVGELFEMRRVEHGEEADWAVDTWAAVGAEVAAALRVSLGKAGSFMAYGLAMSRLPAVAAVFAAGDIDLMLFTTIVYRTELITDHAVLADVDSLLALRAARWPSMTRGKLAAEIDRVIKTRDPDAVRRTRERVRDRDVTVWQGGEDTADVSGRLFAADAVLLDKRLDALAATVCAQDPRTLGQRRADALGALAAGADRLRCQCGGPDCSATTGTASGVVIHVVANRSSLDGADDIPGYLLGADALISADLLRELAAEAKLRPLLPAGSPVEKGYRPSRALADFVRARDLTCRAPGCDRPATVCQLDHTVPFQDGGVTHASNIKCLCMVHHLIKTFWGWKDRQLPDGTVIWTIPDGQTYVTTPGSALLFPALTNPTGSLPKPTAREPVVGGDRAAMMPRRKTTRAQNRARRITAERNENHLVRRQRDAEIASVLKGSIDPNPEGDDPPF